MRNYTATVALPADRTFKYKIQELDSNGEWEDLTGVEEVGDGDTATVTIGSNQRIRASDDDPSNPTDSDSVKLEVDLP